MQAENIVQVVNLSKIYRNGVVAVADVSFSVNRGEIFGVLGPNGAGKSTILEILETLRTKTAGSVRIGGYDIETAIEHIKTIIGIQLQFSTFYPRLKVGELFKLYAGLLQKSVDTNEIMDLLNLSEKRTFYYSQLSGGEKQRLALGVALLSQPHVLYLDEPSTALDPNARRQMLQWLKNINASGVTIILTTHYMEEAQLLCDRVAIIDAGQVIAMGTPAQLLDHARKQSPQPALLNSLEDVFVLLTNPKPSTTKSQVC